MEAESWQDSDTATEIHFTDLVHEGLLKDVDQWATTKLEHFDRFYGKVFFHPAATAGPLHNCQGEFVGFDRYFIDVRNEDPIEVKVRLHPHHKLQVRFAGRWVSINRVLKDLPPPKLQLDTPGPTFETQKHWWQKNGKSFQLMKLPLEVREVIYGFTIADNIFPYPFAKCYGLRPGDAKAMAERNVNMNLRRTSRKVYKEVGSVVFRHATFRITHTPLLQHISHDDFLASNLTRLRLELKHTEFVRIFGLFINWDYYFHARESTQALRQMKLNELVLEMPSPIYFQHDGEVVTCQRRWVDYILEAAFDWVKGHPVRITGYVKPEQKEVFEGKCAEQRREYSEWCELKPLGYEQGTVEEWDEYNAQDEGGVRLDGGEAMRVVQVEDRDRVEREYPPICACLEKCSIEAFWEVVE